ncbi:MAG TPA: hypothetical protein VKE94_01400 [Gemmataceae bacterium]|nr:hypothetical protein [Gemmataceae bacterium]
MPTVARGTEKSLAEARATRIDHLVVADFLRFLVVAYYLACVAAWLVVSRQIRPNFSVRRTIRSFFLRWRAPQVMACDPQSNGRRHLYEEV